MNWNNESYQNYNIKTFICYVTYRIIKYLHASLVSLLRERGEINCNWAYTMVKEKIKYLLVFRDRVPHMYG